MSQPAASAGQKQWPELRIYNSACISCSMRSQTHTFGTLVRNLSELVDQGTEQAYRDLGLDYRPRYTPVVRAILELGPSSIRAISSHMKITHSAAGQTVAHMARHGLVHLLPGSDARERIVAFTAALEGMLPTIRMQWRANNAVAAELEAELSAPISGLLREAISALEMKPLHVRLSEIKSDLEARA
jgi:hypothetical protein